MTLARRAAGPVLAACWLLLAGCATQVPLLDSTARAVELADTPFHPQRDFQCGPAALATVLGSSGVEVAPDTLTPLVYLPERRGSLQIEMQAAPRRFERLSYRIGAELEDITAELEAGRPVLVLHNYGLPFWPRWHYAVVIGFDPARQQVVLRSGTNRRQVLSARNFMRAWDNADRWAMVLLRPGELPARPDRATYLESATAFERSATPASAIGAYDAALQRWPDDPVPHVGRGTARYRAGALRDAAADYRRALALDPSLVIARNNLAMTLLDLGCPAAARGEVDAIDLAPLPAALRSAIEDTRSRITARAAAQEAPGCPGY